MSADINAIKSFDTSKHLYLFVEGKGAAKHLNVTHVGCLGRLFMKMGCHKASMKNLIEYLDSTYFPSLDDTLKQKLKDKIQKYAHNHPKFIIPPYVNTILKTKLNPSSSNSKADKIIQSDGYFYFEKKINEYNVTVSRSTTPRYMCVAYSMSDEFQKLLKEVNYREWKQDKKIIQKKNSSVSKILPDPENEYFDLLNQIIEKKVNALIYKKKDLSSHENTINIHDILLPLWESPLRIKLLSEQKLLQKNLQSIHKFLDDELDYFLSCINQWEKDGKKWEAKEELEALAKANNIVELEKHSKLLKFLDDQTILDLVKNQILNQTLFDTLFCPNKNLNLVTKGLNLITKDNVNYLAQFISNYSNLPDDVVDEINFDTIKKLKASQVDIFYRNHPKALQKLKEDQLDELITKNSNFTSLLGNISEKQVKFLKPSYMNVKLFTDIFGKDSKDPKLQNIKQLTPKQVEEFLPHFADIHWKLF